jgi:acetyl esterase
MLENLCADMLDLSCPPPYHPAEMENKMSDNTPYVRPDVAMFLQFLNAVPGPKFWEVPAVEARAMTAAMRDVADAPVGELAVIRDIAIPGPAGTIPVRLYDKRESRGAGPVMVFYHGGGFVIGSLHTYEPYCAEVARLLDLPVISVDYRLSPEYPFPAPAEDCEAATRWIASSPSELGLDVTGLITSGDSAGGNLTIVTTMALRDNPAAVPVLVQHPIYPVVTLDDDWPSMREFATGYLLTDEAMAYFSDGHAATPGDYRAEPLNFDQTGMPPSLVTTASLDPLRDQGLAYVAKLKEAGVRVEHISADGTIHGHINIRQGIPSTQQDIEGYVAALKSMLAEVMADA